MSNQPGRKLVVCADGTWNPVEKTKEGVFISTNVSKLAASLARHDQHGREQILRYFEGVGTNPEEKVGGGAFGYGLSDTIVRAYEFLVDTYEPGDTLHFFGFSRGAYTVRSLAGMLARSGLLRRSAKDRLQEAFALYRSRAKDDYTDHVKTRVFRQMYSREVDVEFIGVWDTVGSLGIPFIRYKIAQLLGYEWQFHDVELGPHIRHACHALAIHERRSKFRPSVWQKPVDRTNQTLEQVWFCGAHGDVGGGYAESDHSDVTLAWMIERASDPMRGGLAFRPTWKADAGWRGEAARLPFHSEFKGFFRILDWLAGFKSGTMREFNKAAIPDYETCEEIHPTVAQRRANPINGDFWPPTFDPAP